MPMVRRSCATRRRATTVLVAGAGHRQERHVPDEHEAERRRCRAARRRDRRRRHAIMFLTKKHISRRTVLRGAAPCWRCRFSTRWCRRATALAQTAARAEAAVRRPVRAARHGARATGCRRRKARWRPSCRSTGSRSSRSAKQTVILSGLHSRSAEPPPGVTGADHWVAAAFLCAEQAEEDGRRRRLRRHDDRPDHRAEDRAREPDAVDAAGGRGSRRQLEQLRRRLQLHLHEHDLVGVADLAAADGAEPAGGVRADVRRRQHGRAARVAPQARPEHPGFADRQRLTGCAATSARRDRARLDSYAENVREIERRLADCDEGVDGGAGEHARCRSACRRRSTSTSSCSSICWRWRSRPTSPASARCSSRATSPAARIRRAKRRPPGFHGVSHHGEDPRADRRTSRRSTSTT